LASGRRGEGSAKKIQAVPNVQAARYRRSRKSPVHFAWSGTIGWKGPRSYLCADLQNPGNDRSGSYPSRNSGSPPEEMEEEHHYPDYKQDTDEPGRNVKRKKPITKAQWEPLQLSQACRQLHNRFACQRGKPRHAQHGCRLRIRAWFRLPDRGLESCLLRDIQVTPRSASLSWEAKGPCGGAGLAQLGRKGNATKRIAGPSGFPSPNLGIAFSKRRKEPSRPLAY
jgi:hypothetical protein